MRVNDLVVLLEKSWRECKFCAFRRKLYKEDITILDDMVYVLFNKEGAERLVQLISD